jgi:hypothetical protein
VSPRSSVADRELDRVGEARPERVERIAAPVLTEDLDPGLERRIDAERDPGIEVVALACAVVAPGDDRPVAAPREAVQMAGGDLAPVRPIERRRVPERVGGFRRRLRPSLTLASRLDLELRRSARAQVRMPETMSTSS